MGINTDYSEDALPAYTPMSWSLKEIRAAIPPRYFVRDTRRGLLYVARDITLASLAFTLASHIDPCFKHSVLRQILTPYGAEVSRWTMWCIYWWFQSLIFTGIWTIGHDCGHGAFSDHKFVNDVIGFITHTFLWTPYFSFKISHHRHHSNHASMERDQVYVPKTREDLGLPEVDTCKEIDYDEILGDTPIYVLYMVIRQQILGFPGYLLINASGQKNYPKSTSHFNPASVLFTKAQRNSVILSNFGIAIMIWGVSYSCSVYGLSNTFRYYAFPWILMVHWIILITYLQHTDVAIPHYRGKEWNFPRGAAATIDRDILGWQGRFFLHDIAHHHVMHHFFPKMPFYHISDATPYLKAFIGEHYNFSAKNGFKALWETYNNCQFVENEGDVIFYRDRKGKAARRPADQYRISRMTPL